MVSRSWYSQAVELLMCPTATLLSDVEPIENLVKTVRSGNTHAERISAMLTSPAMTETHDFSYRSVILTLSERKVLRLLGKGWGINQIAVDSICQCNTPFNYLFRCFELQCLSRSVV